MDTIELAGEKMAASEVPASADVMKKDCDLPVKPDNCNKLGNIDILGVYNLNRCASSSVETDAPFYPMNDAGVVVEELTLNNYKAQCSASVCHSVRSEKQHFYQLTDEHGSGNAYDYFKSNEEDTILLAAKEDLRRMHNNVKDKKLSSKENNLDPGKIYADGYGKIVPSSEQPLGGSHSKILSFSRYPQFFGKKSLKGKGVISGTGITSDAILNLSAKDDNFVKHSIDSVGFKPLCEGISLREWLKLGSHVNKKAENLSLFRQVVQIVNFAHSREYVLLDLCPSHFILLPSRRLKYTGSSKLVHRNQHSAPLQDIGRKRQSEHDSHAYNNMGVKQQKISGSDGKYLGRKGSETQNTSTHQNMCTPTKLLSTHINAQLEDKWYICPEERGGMGMFSSNIYSLGVLLFELLCCFDSPEAHFAAMLDLKHRIFPSQFISENPKETGFCFWLLHPDPSSRPTTREILQSDLTCGSEDLYSRGDMLTCLDSDENDESELLHFLFSLKEEKEKHASKLAQDIELLEADLKEIERKWGPRLESNMASDIVPGLPSMSYTVDSRLSRNVHRLSNVYFFLRSPSQPIGTAASERLDKDLLRNRDSQSRLQNENKEHSNIDGFFEGLCKFAHYSKFKVCGTLRNGSLLNSANMICSLSFDRDEDYIATAGVSKKIKIFEFGALLNDNVDIHCPIVELMNKSKLSCVCWNKYIRNYLASTDYDGVVQMWDASTGVGFAQYVEHQKRAWSIDFSQANPKMFASGSDDCSVKLWSIDEKHSVSIIRNLANVCCVQFSASSSHLLAFGSADYKIYGYDIRHTRIPWCTLAGHGKAVSYVKFLDSETLVSASTDNTLRLWDLKKTNFEGMSSDACTLTFTGHANEKNFVGLSVFDGYISCGSETNEVYTYYKSLPLPLASHKFGSVDPISGHEVGDDSGQFVSSVCWRSKSETLVAANSSGSIKLLKLV